MLIGLSCDLKINIAPEQDSPEDFLEEYDSTETADIIAGTLEAKGHSVVMLGGGSRFLDNIRREKVDIVFNISEGRGNYRSREAQVPSILEMLSIPYTGSDPLCLALCLDKLLTKKLVAVEGVNTPGCQILNREDELLELPWDGLSFPVILKPAFEGSSKGIRSTSVAHSVSQAQEAAVKMLKSYKQPIMVEEFIDGDEITVGLIGNSPPVVIGIMGVVPKNKVEHFVYSLEVKRDYLNMVDYECPANLPPGIMGGISDASLKVFKSLGCRDFARIDFRVSSDGTPYFIEINPLPGLGTYSDLVIMAKMMGWTHRELIFAVLTAALKRNSLCQGV
ncbi:MAG: ATP-grasp domain-containing protein [Dehalococcoidia bacterium]|nr:ATP-grasp domain-containing protein [Dehalococcoidia bacterium]